MGWTGGQGLGKSNQGITEPIKVSLIKGHQSDVDIFVNSLNTSLIIKSVRY